jgi:hypothetical protein
VTLRHMILDDYTIYVTAVQADAVSELSATMPVSLLGSVAHIGHDSPVGALK